MSNGNGVRQDQPEGKEEDRNPYQMVEDFLQGLTGMDYSDVVMAMLAGAARVSILENDSLELFKAQSVVAYERMLKMIQEAAPKPQMFMGAVRRDC